jgi:hypothetical protein
MKIATRAPGWSPRDRSMFASCLDRSTMAR